MVTSQIYVVIAISILAVIGVFLFIVKKGRRTKKLTAFGGLAFGFILAGILFGNNRWLGYSLIGVGVVIAITDIVLKLRNK